MFNKNLKIIKKYTNLFTINHRIYIQVYKKIILEN